MRYFVYSYVVHINHGHKGDKFVCKPSPLKLQLCENINTTLYPLHLKIKILINCSIFSRCVVLSLRANIHGAPLHFHKEKYM